MPNNIDPNTDYSNRTQGTHQDVPTGQQGQANQETPAQQPAQVPVQPAQPAFSFAPPAQEPTTTKVSYVPVGNVAVDSIGNTLASKGVSLNEIISQGFTPALEAKFQTAVGSANAAIYKSVLEQEAANQINARRQAEDQVLTSNGLNRQSFNELKNWVSGPNSTLDPVAKTTLVNMLQNQDPNMVSYAISQMNTAFKNSTSYQREGNMMTGDTNTPNMTGSNRINRTEYLKQYKQAHKRGDVDLMNSLDERAVMTKKNDPVGWKNPYAYTKSN